MFEEGRYARAVVGRLCLPEPRPLTEAEKELQMPPNLADVDSYELSRLMTGFAAMQNFADYQAKMIGHDLYHLESRLEAMIDERFSNVHGRTIAEKKARAKSLPEVRRIADECDKLRAVYETVQTLRDIYGRCYQTVSREITRRQGSLEP